MGTSLFDFKIVLVIIVSFCQPLGYKIRETYSIHMHRILKSRMGFSPDGLVPKDSDIKITALTLRSLQSK